MYVQGIFNLLFPCKYSPMMFPDPKIYEKKTTKNTKSKIGDRNEIEHWVELKLCSCCNVNQIAS